MGSWGEGPFDSDSGLDWLDIKIHDYIASEIRRVLERFLNQRVRKVAIRVVDPAKAKEYAAWMKQGRRRGRSRDFVPYKSRDRGLEKWRQKWASFHTTMMLPGRRYQHEEAECAAGLLDELTPYSNVYMSYTRRKLGRGGYGCRIKRGVAKATLGARRMTGKLPVHVGLNYEAERGLLYTLAAKAIREILADQAWLQCWRSPEKKKDSLLKLAASLESKIPSERAERVFAKTFKGFVRRKRRKA